MRCENHIFSCFPTNGSTHDSEKDQTEGEGDTYPHSVRRTFLVSFALLSLTVQCRGLDNAGKTTLLRTVLGESNEHTAPTLGFTIKTIQHNQFALNLWDIGGQKTIRSYWRNYFEATDGILWVVDASDRRRIKDCRGELMQVLSEQVRHFFYSLRKAPVNIEADATQRLGGATLLVFANKQDVPGALTAEEIKQVR